MSTSTLSLLALSSRQALEVMVQESLNPGISANDLTFDKPYVETGNEMSVRVGIAGHAYERDDFPYFGAVSFGYKRLDLNDALGFLNLSFETPFPLVTSHVAALMEEALGIDFELEDYIEELIEPTGTTHTYSFKAAPNSPRWMGAVTVQLYKSAG